MAQKINRGYPFSILSIVCVLMEQYIYSTPKMNAHYKNKNHEIKKYLKGRNLEKKIPLKQRMHKS